MGVQEQTDLIDLKQYLQQMPLKQVNIYSRFWHYLIN